MSSDNASSAVSNAEQEVRQSSVDARLPAPETTTLLPKGLQWLIIGVVGLCCLLLAFVLPAPYSTVLLSILVIGSVVVGVILQRRSGRHGDKDAARIERSGALRLLLPAAEIGLIVIIALAANWNFIRADEFERVNGHELEWLTSSAHFAHLSLRDYGYLPLWQPYNDFGEPLIDNPFSFVLNPLSAGPTLLVGSVQGIKISIVIYGVFAGLGGYFLARVLGLGAAGRLLLGLLMIGKGNMLAMIGTGYYQLGVAQAYFPWIVGTALVVLRQKQARWAVVLLAVMLTLMFWAGNIWYMLPILLGLLLLTGFHVIPWGGRTFDSSALRRMLLAAVLTVGLCAVTLLPIFGSRDYVGRHPREVMAGVVTDPLVVAQQFVTGDRALFDLKIDPYQPQFYYSYVTPLWFLALLLLLLPPVGALRALNSASLPQAWRIWVPGLIMLIGSFIWGVGGNPLMIWLYDTIPLLAQWRFVGRALAVTSFWLVVLMALRLDSLSRLIYAPVLIIASLPEKTVRAAQRNLGALLLVVTLIAAFQVDQAASYYAKTTGLETEDTRCIAWLRQQLPNEQLALWRLGYDVTTPFLDNRIRQVGIEADYVALPQPSTVGQIDLTRSRAKYAIGWHEEDRNWLRRDGYVPVVDGPRSEGVSCLYRYPNALSYAYKIPLIDIETAFGEELDPELTIPINSLQRLPDRILLSVTGDAEHAMVVTIQESAYSGWEVWVNGTAATLQSVGGQVGVLLPSGEGSYDILFAYRPPLFFAGGIITLVTWIAAVGYLLRAERLLNQIRGKGREPQAALPAA
ncbi:MAG: hypothetical protein KC547_14840 [Anaerolineae bacterium]|nr:hypothetical protein [Anaerolineae bacterium]